MIDTLTDEIIYSPKPPRLTTTFANVLDAPQGIPVAMLTAVSDHLLYARSIHPELRTIEPFDVRFERTDGGYAAIIHELNEYGLGNTRSEALEDLHHTLQELYLSLEQDQARLSADLISVWAKLKIHVTRISR